MTVEAVYWNGRRCVVTGAGGFVGSHLCRALVQVGADVVAIDRAFESALDPAPDGRGHLSVVQCDLAEPTAVSAVVARRPEVIFHLAGSPYAPFTTRFPQEAVRCNVTTTAHMLEAARRLPGARLVLASSACVFGATRESPLRLDTPVSDPEHFYSFTKREAEALTRRAHADHGVRATICRFGNIYGAGDRHGGRIVPQVCAQLLDGPPDTLRLRRSRGDSVFEFLYVTDAVDGLMRASARPTDTVDTWQFSGGEATRIAVRDLAALLSRLFDGVDRPVVGNETNPERPVVKYLDTADTRRELGWDPRYDLTNGLSATLTWYRAHRAELRWHGNE